MNIAPPLLHLPPERFSGHVGYSMAKYGISVFVLGMAEEFKTSGIAVNALWPKSGTGNFLACELVNQLTIVQLFAGKCSNLDSCN